MARFLVIGDPHFKVNNAEETDQMHKLIIKHLEKSEPYDFIVNLGDTLHDHSKLEVRALYRAMQFLKDLSRFSLVITLRGNHDSINNSSFLENYCPFMGLENHKNLCFINKPTQIFEYLFCPYVANNRFFESLKVSNIDLETISIVFAHQEFKNVNMGGFKSEIDESWPETNPVLISGHIHTYQIVQDNLIYPGTPLVVSFGEDPDKALLVVNHEKDIITYKRLRLGFPKKYTENLTIGEAKDKLKSFKIGPYDMVRWIIEGSTNEIEQFKKKKIPDRLKIVYQPTDRFVALKSRSFRSFEQILEKRLERDELAFKFYKKLKN